MEFGRHEIRHEIPLLELFSLWKVWPLDTWLAPSVAWWGIPLTNEWGIPIRCKYTNVDSIRFCSFKYQLCQAINIVISSTYFLLLQSGNGLVCDIFSSCSALALLGGIIFTSSIFITLICFILLSEFVRPLSLLLHQTNSFHWSERKFSMLLLLFLLFEVFTFPWSGNTRKFNNNNNNNNGNSFS